MIGDYMCFLPWISPMFLPQMTLWSSFWHMDSICPIVLLRLWIRWVSLISWSLSLLRFSLSSVSSSWSCSCSSSFRNWCIFAYSDTTTCLQVFVSSCHHACVHTHTHTNNIIKLVTETLMQIFNPYKVQEFHCDNSWNLTHNTYSLLTSWVDSLIF